MLDVAMNTASRPITLKQVAQRQGISEKYLWQVIAPLKSNGLITAQLGARGGYRVARPPSRITLKDILDLLGGTPVLESTAGSAEREGGGASVTREIWGLVSHKLVEVVDSITLQDMVKRYTARKSSADSDYAI